MPPAESDLERRKRRRAELGAFLRARRRALRPVDVGITPIGRRHVEGLRREEVAALAGIGVSWYTLLEQGAMRRVTRQTLAAVAAALRLNDVERDHVVALASDDLPDHDAHAASPAVVRVVEGLSHGPAFLLSPAYDVLAWNAPAERIFAFGARAPEKRNLLRAVLFDPDVMRTFVTWEHVVRDMVAVVRANFARSGGPAFEALIDDLLARSPVFRAQWNAAIVGPVPAHERCRMRVPGGDDVTVDLTAFAPHDAPGQTMIVLVPEG